MDERLQEKRRKALTGTEQEKQAYYIAKCRAEGHFTIGGGDRRRGTFTMCLRCNQTISSTEPE